MKIAPIFLASLLKDLSLLPLHPELRFPNVKKFRVPSGQVRHDISPLLSVKGRVAFADLPNNNPGLSLSHLRSVSLVGTLGSEVEP